MPDTDTKILELFRDWIAVQSAAAALPGVTTVPTRKTNLRRRVIASAISSRRSPRYRRRPRMGWR